LPALVRQRVNHGIACLARRHCGVVVLTLFASGAWVPNLGAPTATQDAHRDERARSATKDANHSRNNLVGGGHCEGEGEREQTNPRCSLAAASASSHFLQFSRNMFKHLLIVRISPQLID